MRYRNFCISWIVCFCLLSCEQSENVPRVFGDEISLSEKELVINRTGNQFSFDLFRQLSTLDSTDNLFVVHPTFRVIRQSCRAYNLSLK